MKKYFKVWKQLSYLAISSYLSSRIDSSTYLLGKLIRFGFFLLLILSIFNHVDYLAGYTKYETLLFFLTFNLMDVLTQAFFRGIYFFRNDIRLGTFDFILLKPINTLFYSLTKLMDILDMFFLIPIISLIVFVIFKLELLITVWGIISYLIFIIFGLLIILGIHIISACVAILTQESENFILLYRESMTIGRFPPEVYSRPFQLIFTFIMPIIVVVSFPVKALLGTLSYFNIVLALIITLVFFGGSLFFWKTSLKHYGSASS